MLVDICDVLGLEVVENTFCFFIVGIGVDVDHSSTGNSLRDACTFRYKNGWFVLAQCLKQGIGITANKISASEKRNEPATDGNFNAKWEKALCYFNGDG